jgi:hypothetical protein
MRELIECTRRNLGDRCSGPDNESEISGRWLPPLNARSGLPLLRRSRCLRSGYRETYLEKVTALRYGDGEACLIVCCGSRPYGMSNDESVIRGLQALNLSLPNICTCCLARMNRGYRYRMREITRRVKASRLRYHPVLLQGAVLASDTHSFFKC